MRPDWDNYFLGVAEAVARRGDCIRRQVGAVLVDSEKRIVSTGYNGSLPGGKSCLAGECPRCLDDTIPSGEGYEFCLEFHAEWNAVTWWDDQGKDPLTMYVTYAPCSGCQELLRSHGIYKIIWHEGYRDLSLPKMS